jgi:hypothetical protein
MNKEKTIKNKKNHHHMSYNKNKTRRRHGGRTSHKLKQMNCNPIVKGKTIVKGSCFTQETIQKLKLSYNKHHPRNKILDTKPVAIWLELKKRFSTCSKEDCWLHVIQDKAERAKLDHYLFAPDHPAEWNRTPDAWLSNFDIMKVLRQYEETYPNFRIIGPTPIDFDSRSPTGNCVWQELCDFDLEKFMAKGKTKLSVVFNLSASDEPGSHWVSLFIDLEDKFIFFFDSAALPNKKEDIEFIPHEIEALVKKIMGQYVAKMGTELTYYDNRGVDHQHGNTECGMYSLYFIITMLTGESKGRKIADYKKKIEMFKSKNNKIPDVYVSKYRKIYFNS